MRDREFYRPERQRDPQRLLDARGNRPSGVARLDIRDTADLVIVDDQQIEMRQTGSPNARTFSRLVETISRLVSRPRARAAFKVAAQPVVSSRQGASMIS